MTMMLIGMVLFFGAHSVSIVLPKTRDQLAAQHPLLWRGIYSLISLIGIVLMVKGYAADRTTSSWLYSAPVWMWKVTAVLNLPVFMLLIAPYFPGKISKWTRHPQLLGVILWSAAHLLVNGRLVDALLFGSFLAWATADLLSMNYRNHRPVPSLPALGINDAIVVALGLMLYLLVVKYLHEAWIGVLPHWI